MTPNTSELNNLDIISVIWILACNDENPLITYRGLVHRIGLPDEDYVRQIIASRPELFRKGATATRIEEWKAKLRAGKNMPGWISEISPGLERDNIIEGLSSESVFRSQFRAHSNAERSPIEIIQWGLEHIDRLRKTKSEANEFVAKKWQMWLVFGVSVAGVITQLIIAFLKK